MKLTKRLATVGAAVMMMASMSAIGASASNGVEWKVYTLANNPSGTGVTTVTKTVSGLTTSSDDAIDFTCGYFTGGSGSTYAHCDIQSNMKKYSTQYADLYEYGDSGSVKFKSGWYAYSNKGKCSVTVSLVNYSGTNGVEIRGNAK